MLWSESPTLKKYQVKIFCEPESQMQLLKVQYLVREPYVPEPWSIKMFRLRFTEILKVILKQCKS